MPQSMGLQRVRHELTTGQQQNMVHRKKIVKLNKASGRIPCLQNCPKITDICPSISFIRGFPDSAAGKESACNAGDPGSIPQLGRCPGEGKGYPVQYFDLESSLDSSPWGRKGLDTTG